MAKTRPRGPTKLEPAKVVETMEALQKRVQERFPDSGLAGVCADLSAVARKTQARAWRLSRPYYFLRLLSFLTVSALLAGQGWLVLQLYWGAQSVPSDVISLTQGLEAAVSLLLVAFAALWFLLTLEERLKRRRVMEALYELRSFAHVIDMHQLTKDPTYGLAGATPTASSPSRELRGFELVRYLDYCAEALSLTAKLAALYAGQFHDAAVLAAVNDLESLTSDLGRKIWQKITIMGDDDEA